MSFENKSIQCFDCGATFDFTVEEQEFFASKGYTNEPKRCPACRQTRKERQGSSSNSYGNNRTGNNGYSSRPRSQMFPATCAQCGKSTQVPFEPREGRPVYCSDCYSRVRVSR